MTHGGVATRASCIAMERTVTQWLAMKYNWLGVDHDGLSEYEVPPEKWADGDLDYVIRWNRFYHQVEHDRTMYELSRFVEEARKRKIDTLVMNAVFPIERKVHWFWKLLAVGGGLYAFKWLMEPPGGMIQAPTINTKPIEDAFQRLAGLEPGKEAIVMEAMVMPEPVVAAPTKEK